MSDEMDAGPGAAAAVVDDPKRTADFASLARPGGLTMSDARVAAFDGYRVKEGEREETQVSGTSIFDPVLCELIYKWFCPAGGVILDPFAGGSVRGIVAALMGREYHGIDLSDGQIEANREQWIDIGDNEAGAGVDAVTDPAALTPVEQRGGYWFKRDDLFQLGGAIGGKARTCYALARAAAARGAAGIVTAGSRASPQVNIVAHVARHLGLAARCHTPEGELSPEVRAAQAAGAEIVQHPAGYNSVIIARARADAAARGWGEIPFGMECVQAVTQTRRQVANLPAGVKRIVVPCGSGMSLCGILWGLADAGRHDVQVLAVRVGADPQDRITEYAPVFWEMKTQIVQAAGDYHAPAPETVLAGVALDPYYEAKCIPFMQPGDLLWVVGLRGTAAPPAAAPAARPGSGQRAPTWYVGDSRDVREIVGDLRADLVFTCPPYADLEVYSDDPRDLSAVPWEQFKEGYAAIIKGVVDCMKPDSFAVFVVGDARGKDGFYYGLPWATVAAFEAAGARLYNEAVLVTAVGSLPVRINNQFTAGRKLGKTHQNILMFCKGDWRKAAAKCEKLSAADGVVEA